MEKVKEYTCMRCKGKSNSIGICQLESLFYHYNIETKQMEDFHGSGSVEKQFFYCLRCNKRIAYKYIKEFI